MVNNDLRYPIGNYSKPDNYTQDDFKLWIKTIERFPSKVKDEVSKLSNEELGWRYRPDGWSIRQVVHHCADSHMNSFIRFKLALTEDCPTIKPYNEAEWAKLPDTVAVSIEESLSILRGLHARWSCLLKNMSLSDQERHFFHPEWKDPFEIGKFASLYHWHCNHHLAHIKQAKKAKGKFN